MKKYSRPLNVNELTLGSVFLTHGHETRVTELPESPNPYFRFSFSNGDRNVRGTISVPIEKKQGKYIVPQFEVYEDLSRKYKGNPLVFADKREIEIEGMVREREEQREEELSRQRNRQLEKTI